MVFFIPFFGLLSRAAKVFRPTLVLFTVISLVGMYLVRYLEVYPSLYGEVTSMPFGFWEIGVTLGFVGPVGQLLPGLHERLPARARRAHDVAVSRRGAGAGESGDDGAAAGARVDAVRRFVG